MLTQTLPIRDDNPAVVLEAYVLKNSREFQADVRRPAVIICPGGGYLFTSDREAEPVALRFLAAGDHTFVLRYSVGTRFPQPMHDLARAMTLLREHADEWFLDPERIALCGFSAGGHLAAALGVMWQEPWLSSPLGVDAQALRPSALILGYPAIDLDLIDNAPRPNAFDPAAEAMRVRDLVLATVLGGADQAEQDRYRLDRQVSTSTPPTFLWHTADDDLAFVQNSLRFALSLAEKGVPHELHVFESGVHGLSLADATTDDGGRMLNPDVQVWVDLALKWLQRREQPRGTGQAQGAVVSEGLR